VVRARPVRLQPPAHRGVAAPDVEAAVATTEAYFAELLARRSRLGLAPEADRTEMDGVAGQDAA
jgi:hypothetical protein